MWILLVAILLLGLKLGEVGPFASVSWWWIGVPLAVVFVWWEIIDPWLGISQKRAIRKVEQRRNERTTRARRNLGLRAPRDGRDGR